MPVTQSQLIQETIAVIDRDGYRNLSLRGLVQSLDVTTGAFYRHFTSKDDLFEKVTAKLSQDFVDAIAQEPGDEGPVEQLLRIAQYFVNQTVNHPNIMDFLFFNEEASSALANDPHSYPFLERMRSLVEAIDVRSGICDQDFFVQIWSFIQGYALLVREGAATYSRSLVALTLNQMMNGER